MKKSNQTHKRNYLKQVAALILILGFALVFLYSLTLQESYRTFITYAESIISQHSIKGSVGFIVIEALSVMLSPFSSVPFTVIAVSIWGKTITLLYSFIGGLVGTTLAYLIGMHALYHLLKRFIPVKDIEYYGTLVSKKSPFWLVVLFVMAMPVEVPGYVLGIARYPFKKYLGAVSIGYLPFYTITVFAGQAFTNNDGRVFFALVLSLIALFGLSLYFFYRWLKKEY